MSSRALRRALPLAVVAASLVASQTAAAYSLLPPPGKVYLGVSDRGQKTGTAEFEAFAKNTGKHPAVLQTFLKWGEQLTRPGKIEKPYERWRKTKTRPMIHISTQKEEDKEEVEILTPKQIALGEGDDYLLYLNKFFSEHKLAAYLRPLGEPNRCKNLWSAVECKEHEKPHFKGGAHTAYWYKQAFRRIALIVRGNYTLKAANAILAKLKLPPITSTEGPPPKRLPNPPVMTVWSTLSLGSPENMKGNEPLDYWPGGEWVGMVGVDFYPHDQKFKNLDALYSNPKLAGKPFGLTEWAVKGKDKPGWAENVINWTLARHKRVKILAYYDGFGKWNDKKDPNEYELHHWPHTEATIRRLFKDSVFLGYAKPNASEALPPPRSP